MASVESIGSCSLDADVTAASAADSELYGCGSVSERTLHSLNLSTKTPDTDLSSKKSGSTTPEYVKRTAKLFESSVNDESADDRTGADTLAANSVLETQVLINGIKESAAKKPSYLNLACSISGYTTITNYDSKLREGFRSRDQSPGRLIVGSRDVSPLRFSQAQIDGASLRCRSDCGKFLAAPGVAPYRANGDAKSGVTRTFPLPVNGAIATRMSNPEKRDASSAINESSRNFMSTMLSSNGNSSTSCEVTSRFQSRCTNHESRNGSAVNGSGNRSPGSVKVVEFTSQSASFVTNGQNGAKSYSKFSETKSHFVEKRPPAEGRGCGNGEGGGEWTGSASNNKSFIQQRVERLYGPGALAQGFFRRASSGQGQPTDQTSAAPSANGQASLPVLRHLRPEFRAQLSLGSAAHRVDKVATAAPAAAAEDVLPAAPEVVLPVEPVKPLPASSAAAGETRDGAYFLGLLRVETEAILALADRTERDMKRDSPLLSEEAQGRLRAAIGQARLLVKQKLVQFEGLCHKNMAQSPGEPFPTTTDDLAGFWDMVQLQIHQVHTLFAELAALQAAGWPDASPSPVPDAVDGPKRRPAPKRAVKATPASSELRKAREEARAKMMEQRRKELKEQGNADGVEIFAPQENGK